MSDRARMSKRELSLTMKAIVSRQVRESSKLASAVVASRFGGKSCDERRDRVGCAHDAEKVRARRCGQQRAALYGNAVTEANKRGNKHASQKEKSFAPPRYVRGRPVRRELD